MDIEKILAFRMPRYNELPSIELYIDQVLSYIESIFLPLEMSEIEKLVPPYELCKSIPKGEFTDSVFVWARYPEYLPCDSDTIPEGIGEKVVMLRNACLENNIMAPAPTLQEVLDIVSFNILFGSNIKVTAENGLRQWLYFVGIKEDK